MNTDLKADEQWLSLNESTIAMFGATILLLGAIVWMDGSSLIEKTDFSVTYIGARLVREGLGTQLYDLAAQEKAKKSLLPNAEPLIYEHPPFEAGLLSPLGGLPYRTAYLVWALLNASIWLVLPWVVRPFVPVPRDNLIYLAGWFIFAPLGVTLFQGQSSLFLLLLFILTFIQLRRGHEFAAGVCLGLGLFKFQFVLPFIFILLLRRKWRCVAGFATAAFALALVSLAAVGTEGVSRYFRLLEEIATNPKNVSMGSATDMATLHGFAHAVLGDALSAKATLILVSFLSLVLSIVIARLWDKSEHDGALSELMFAAAIVGSLVMGSHMFTHDLSPLLLSMLLVLAHLSRSQSITLRAVLWTTFGLFWIPAVYFALIAWHRMYLLLPVLIVFGTATITLAFTQPSLYTKQRSMCPDAAD